MGVSVKKLRELTAALSDNLLNRPLPPHTDDPFGDLTLVVEDVVKDCEAVITLYHDNTMHDECKEKIETLESDIEDAKEVKEKEEKRARLLCQSMQMMSDTMASIKTELDELINTENPADGHILCDETELSTLLLHAVEAVSYPPRDETESVEDRDDHWSERVDDVIVLVKKYGSVLCGDDISVALDLLVFPGGTFIAYPKSVSAMAELRTYFSKKS